MTRINLVPPAELCDQHLLAEYRELTRIPHVVLKKGVGSEPIPPRYTIQTADNPKGGRGHVRFFYNKMEFLYQRYGFLRLECETRWFRAEWRWTDAEYNQLQRLGLWQNYEPTEEAILLNKKRILERLPANARWTNRRRPGWTTSPTQYSLPLAFGPQNRVHRSVRIDSSNGTSSIHVVY